MFRAPIYINKLHKKCEICRKDIYPKPWANEFKLKFCYKHEMEEREKEATRLAAKIEQEVLDL